MKPKRIQRKRTKGWRNPPNTIYAGRPTKWGNPMRVGIFKGFTRADAVRYFKLWIDGKMPINGTLWGNMYGTEMKKAAKRELRRKNLSCWCHLCQKHVKGKPLGIECADCDPCHVDYTLVVANGK